MSKFINALKKYAKQDPQEALNHVYSYVSDYRPNLLQTLDDSLDGAMVARRFTVLNNLSEAVIHYASMNDYRMVIAHAEQAQKIKDSGAKWLNLDATPNGIRHSPLTKERADRVINNLISVATAKE